MILPDVNLLLYVVVTGFPQHPRALAWWNETVSSGASIGLTAPAVFGFLRIATNARIIRPALPVSEAVGYVRGWLAEPNIRELTPTDNHLETAFGLLLGVGTAGNLTTGAQIAAYAIEHRAEVASNDSDFAKFPSLTWRNPL